jgi:N-acetylmuramoyl-L-alanine amidase
MPIQSGVLLHVLRAVGNWLETDLGGDERGWIERHDIAAVDGEPPQAALVRNVIIRPAGNDAFIDIALSRRVAFDGIEEAEPGALVLRLHDAALMMNELMQYAGDRWIASATTRQRDGRTVDLRLQVRGPRLWGWSASYLPMPRLPSDPPGHDYSRYGKENLHVVLHGPPTGWQGLMIVIDPGHGGSDPGAIGLNGLREKDINLQVAEALRQALVARGAQVVMTRDTDRDVGPDKAHELEARVEAARQAGGNLFISIHHNARAHVEDGRIAEGSWVYYYRTQSEDLARAIADPLADALGQPYRGHIWRSFHVTRQTFMPAVLVEVGFLSNPTEEAKMLVADYPRTVAAGIAAGVNQFLFERNVLR